MLTLWVICLFLYAANAAKRKSEAFELISGRVMRSHPSAAKRLQRQLHGCTGLPAPGACGSAAQPLRESNSPTGGTPPCIHSPAASASAKWTRTSTSLLVPSSITSRTAAPSIPAGCGHEHCPPSAMKRARTRPLHRSGTVPKLGEKVTISTWPYDFHGFFGYRNFTMTGEDGECLVYANSIWIYMDTETGRPVKVDQEQEACFRIEEKFPMKYADRKIRMPEETEERECFHRWRSTIWISTTM